MYYLISLYSTPDQSHIDQLTKIFRFMEDMTLVKQFVAFMSNQDHKAQKMFDVLMKFVATHDTDLQNCCGQSKKTCIMDSLHRTVLKFICKCCGKILSGNGRIFDFLEKIFVFLQDLQIAITY